MISITNPAFDYDKGGEVYARVRKTDPRIARYVNDVLQDAKTIINVGAGAGSYEPEDKYVVAVEPSQVMRSQRGAGKVPAMIGTADALPFDTNSFDAAMAMVTVHHWPDITKGLQELRRVAANQVLVMTADPDSLDKFWNKYYFAELIEVERARFPKIETITQALGGNCEIIPIPIPLDCMDGFQEAFYGRPEEFLKKVVRQSQSAWGFLEDGMEDKLVQRLVDDLDRGEWDRRFGAYRKMPEFIGSMRLIIGK